MNGNNIFVFKQFLALFMLAAIGAGCVSTAQAATANWVGNTDANWATSANWTNSQPAGNIATFATAGSSGTTLNNDLAAGTSIAGISYNTGASAYVIGGNDIVLGGTITITPAVTEIINLNMAMNASRTIALSNTSSRLTIGGAISGGYGLTKSGQGTLVLSGANTYTGLTTVQGGGTLNLMGGTGSLSASTGLFLGVSDTTYAGGSSFIYDNAGASGAISQTLASLASQNTQPNDNTVQITRTEAQPVTLTFTNVNANTTENGNVINFVTLDSAGGGVNGTDYKIVLGNQTTYNITSQNAYFNGGDFAVYDTTSGFVRGVKYGSDAGAVTSAGGASVIASGTMNQEITGSVTAQTNATLGASGTTKGTLKISGASNLEMASDATLTLANGIGNSGASGLIKTGGGTSTISGTGSAKISFVQAQADIRVDTADDVLNINIPITLDSKVRFLKSGAGTLVLSNGSFSLIGNASGNGTTAHINGGILEIGGSATITTNASISGTKGAFSVASGARIRHNSTSTTSSIASVIQGQGGVTVSAGILALTGVNTFTGQLTVEGGTLAVAAMNNASASGPLGSSALPVTLGKSSGGAGTLEYTGGTTNTSKPFILATGGMGAFQIDGSSTTQTLSGVISGGGGLIKSGPGALNLTAANTYTGDTSVTNGMLGIAQATLTSNSVVSVASGAVLNLNFSGTNSIAALSLGGTVKSSGVYGAATDPVYLGGTGLLKVGSGIGPPKGTLIMVE